MQSDSIRVGGEKHLAHSSRWHPVVILAAAALVAGTMVFSQGLPVAAGGLLLIALWLYWESRKGRAVVHDAENLSPRSIAAGEGDKTFLPLLIKICLVVLLLALGVTAWITPDPAVTHPQVWRTLVGIGFYLVIILWTTSPARLRGLAWGAVLAGVGLGGFALFSVEWASGKLPFLPEAAWGIYDRLTVVVADTINPNVLAGNLLPFIFLTFGLVVGEILTGTRGAKPSFRWLMILAGGSAGLFMLIMLVLAQSRGALLGVGAGLVVFAALGMLRIAERKPGGAKRAGRLLVAFCLVIGLAGAATWFLGSPELRRDVYLLLGTRLFGGGVNRAEIWSRALYMLEDFPLTGVGMGLFPQALEHFYPLSSGIVPHAHNLFLQVAVDLGIPGFLAWVGIFGISVLLAWRGGMNGKETKGSAPVLMEWNALTPDPSPKLGEGEDAKAANAQRTQRVLWGLSAGLLAGLAAVAVHGLMDAVVWGVVRPAPLLWGFWGMAAAVGVVKMESRDSRGAGWVFRRRVGS